MLAVLSSYLESSLWKGFKNYLCESAAIYAALTSKKLHKRQKDVLTSSERDLASAEELVAVLTSLKIGTTVSFVRKVCQPCQ